MPVAETFRYYHLLHHVHQGEDGTDTDLPTELEGRSLRGPVRKLLWVAGQGFAYALRPLFVHPKKPSVGELLNLLLQLAFNALVLYFWGVKALAYLPISSLIVMGLHPVAGHYVSEHYVFREGQETYSYYGPLNRLTFNVDAITTSTTIFRASQAHAWRAPQAGTRKYYDSLFHHSSWTKTLWQYVARADLGGYSRVKRTRRERAE